MTEVVNATVGVMTTGAANAAGKGNAMMTEAVPGRVTAIRAAVSAMIAAEHPPIVVSAAEMMAEIEAATLVVNHRAIRAICADVIAMLAEVTGKTVEEVRADLLTSTRSAAKSPVRSAPTWGPVTSTKS